MMLFWTVVAAVAASLSAMAAAVYTWLTFSLVRTQQEPKVVVYACGDPDRQTIIMIRIANLGRDVATDVVFKPSRAIPARAYGLTLEEAQSGEEMTTGPLVEGIPVLGPGDTREITWGQFGGLIKAVGKTPIDLAVTYKHGRRTIRGHSRLEVASFSGTDDSDNPAPVSARALQEIAEAMTEIAKVARKLALETSEKKNLNR